MPLDRRGASANTAELPTADTSAHVGVGRWLWVSTGWLVVVAVAFVLGYLLAAHDTEQALAHIQALQTERDMLSEQVATQRDAQIKLERAHQMDVEAQRSAQVQIVALQRSRTRLEQQLTHLRALVGTQAQGLVELKNLVLTRIADGGYRYRLTLGQLVPDFGKTQGDVVLSVVTVSERETTTTAITDLSDAAGRHAMAFEQFQVFEGEFRLPNGAVPLELIIDIVPKDDTLVASQEIVHWASALAAGSAAAIGSVDTAPGREARVPVEARDSGAEATSDP